MRRISRQQLIRTSSELGIEDHLAVTLIKEHRFLTAAHVAGIVYVGATSPLAAVRAAQRQLRKLERLGLAARLPGRTGGTGGGATRDVWHLSEAGHRLADPRGQDTPRPRHRPAQPSTAFLAHALMVADIRLALEQLDRQDAATGQRVELAAVQTEPDCWRPWTGAYGARHTLKPDLRAETTTSNPADPGVAYDDHWFIEADLDTEHLPTILRKARTYDEYRATGQEQAENGVFPLVLWVTHSQHRADNIIAAIQGDPATDRRLHHATPLAELGTFLTNR